MLKKKFLKSKPICKVTFKIFGEDVEANEVALVGDFNDWDKEATPMKALKSGGFTVTIDLEVGKEFQFRYYSDDQKLWFSEKEADKHIYNEYGTENSVVETYV